MTGKAGYNRDYRGSLLSQTKGLLRRLGFKARKRLGQHFLVDNEILEKIASAAELTSGDIVIEVGPGLGVLTKELARQAGGVIAVELDDRLASILEQTMSSAENVTVINKDILKVDPVALLEEQRARLSFKTGNSVSYKVVANIPYYITSPVLRHFLEASVKPRLMVVMVQEEVAEAIVAEPGRMSLLSIGVQFYGKPEIVDYVPARCFYPAPEVDSAILKIKVYPQPVIDVKDTSGFFRLVQAGFTAPRKQLANSLAQGLGLAKSEVLPLLEKAGIIYKRRAETLSLGEWQQLWQVFRRRHNADGSGAS
jgi:16S rRNA (adenine1518-N6/adenine1519-N6)-dimethyltransferase